MPRVLVARFRISFDKLLNRVDKRMKRESYADPRVLECLGGGDALRRVHRQHLVDQVLCFRRDRVPLGRRVLRGNRIQFKCGKTVFFYLRGTHVVRSGLYLCVQPVLVLIPERRVTDQ